MTWKEQGPTSWRYNEAGLVTTDLVPLDEAPRPLFDALDREKSVKLMAAMDTCNSRFGRGAVVPARAGLVEKRLWSTKFEMRSPRLVRCRACRRCCRRPLPTLSSSRRAACVDCGTAPQA
ncbi:DUF4113 domain-containing protein [Methylobacterium terricola]|uniref:DUF4113 domain-containing protein n=1 Tax=Methylobacterium terricola TaxID=2583531 RepID=A0A5C4L6S3_9HYPH|nr:DUF4113 domain-containing protein [Methylobacterium terricola]